MNDIQSFMKILDNNLGYKTAILPLLPKGKVNILDFGGGTGVLSHAIKLSNPNAHVTLLDHNEEMLNIAKSNNTADFYCSSLKELPYETYDAIIFCSVLHEVQDWRGVLKEAHSKLKKGGTIVIRDGLRSVSRRHKRNRTYYLKLRNPKEAQEFFDACDRDSVVGKLAVEIVNGTIVGEMDDVHSFLQTYTWGIEALGREQHEDHLLASREEIVDFFVKESLYRAPYVAFTAICQQNYFKHINKLVEVEEMWNTHMIVQVLKP